MGQPINKPCGGHSRHPGADERNPLSSKEQPVIPVLKSSQNKAPICALPIRMCFVFAGHWKQQLWELCCNQQKLRRDNRRRISSPLNAKLSERRFCVNMTAIGVAIFFACWGAIAFGICVAYSLKKTAFQNKCPRNREIGLCQILVNAPPAKRVASGSPPEGGKSIARGERSEPLVGILIGNSPGRAKESDISNRSLSPFQGSESFAQGTRGSLRSPLAIIFRPSGAGR